MTIQISLRPEMYYPRFKTVDGVDYRRWRTNFDLDGESVQHVIETLTALVGELADAEFEQDSDYPYPHVIGWKPVTPEERAAAEREKAQVEADLKHKELQQLKALKAKYPDA